MDAPIVPRLSFLDQDPETPSGRDTSPSGRSRQSIRATRPALRGAMFFDEAWRGLEWTLSVALPRLRENQFLVIQKKSSHRYVQFFSHGASGLRMESTSNRFLDPNERLSPADASRLRLIGWRSPGHHSEGDAPNYFRDVRGPVAFDEIASLAILTLHEIHRVPGPAALTYFAGSTEHYEALLFPELGLDRQ
jgi:T3SS (YopN, CesT) and YbjN peptide-binding chaperone 3